MSIEVTSLVPTAPETGNTQTIKVKSHWNDPKRVVLVIPGLDNEVVVYATDLMTAVTNATHTAKYG